MKLWVVGGGAAGFWGALRAAAVNPEVQVTLLESGSLPLAKVRISGGGRCNVTHHCFDPAQLVQHYPRGGQALRGAFSRFQPRDTIAWFEQQGVKLKTEADGRMFPVTDDSATIVDCLVQATRESGVRVRLRSQVTQITPLNPGFEIALRSGEREVCDRILLATGSSPQGYRMAEALGHTVEPPVPSLFTFHIADKALHQRSGLAVEPVALKLKVEGLKQPLQQTGPLLVTHWGFSGPAILKLSAWGARALQAQRYHATLQVNWLPAMTLEQVKQALTELKVRAAKRALVTQNPFSLPKRLWQYLVERTALDAQLTWANLSKASMNRLVQELCQGEFAIAGKGIFKDEFVTCGGVRLKEVDFKTMESRLCPGLYFAGEILDIDGITGGFNFQSAWTTGWIAGQAMAS